MRLVVTLLCLLPGFALAEPLLRIAVYEGPGPITLQGERLRVRALDADAGYRPIEAGRIEFSREGEALRFLEERSSALRVRADGPIAVAGARVRGNVEVLAHEGRLLVVNEVPMEAYLAAVLGSEMMPSFHPEALKAQAVAARTYAMRKRLEALDAPYDLGSTVLSQVYEGVHREDPRTHAAVEATAGEVLVFGHEPIEAYFFSSCGGRTASGGEALGRDLPYLVSVPCGEHHDVPRARWELRLPPAELGKKLGLAEVTALRIEERSATQRVESIVAEAGGTRRRFSGAEFRRRLGYGALRSLAFDFERRAGDFHFRGRGFGHGAGLCQWGAQAAGLAGKSHREILEHFYPGAEIRKMY